MYAITAGGRRRLLLGREELEKLVWAIGALFQLDDCYQGFRTPAGNSILVEDLSHDLHPDKQVPYGEHTSISMKKGE